MCLLVNHAAFADTVNLGGLTFSVDALQVVEGNLVKVRIFGKETLVAKEKVSEFVAREHLANAESIQKFNQRELEGFVISASSEHYFELAAMALTALVKKPGVNAQQLRNFIDSYATNQNSTVVIEDTLLKISNESEHGALAASMAVEILGRDSLWLRQHLASWFFVSLEVIRPIVIERYNALTLADSREHAQLLLTNWRELVGADDPTFLELNSIDNKVRSLSEKLKQHDVIGAAVMIDFNDTRPVMHDLLVPMYISAAENEAAELLAKSQPNAAVAVLLHIDFMRRTPKTHELLSQALSSEQLDFGQLVKDSNIRSLLRLYAEKDPAVAEVVLARASKYFSQQVATGQLAAAEDSFSVVRELRPDPDRANGQMRLDLAAAYLGIGDESKAEQQIEQARPMLSSTDFVRVFGLIVRSDWLILTVLLLLLIGSGTLLYFKALPLFSRSLAAVKVARTYKTAAQEDELEEELPRFVQFSGTQKNPDYEEYRRCLAFFQLEPEAPLSAIKNSYRNFVKEHHPDAQGANQSANSNEEFRLALEIYNRILELRKKFSST